MNLNILNDRCGGRDKKKSGVAAFGWWVVVGGGVGRVDDPYIYSPLQLYCEPPTTLAILSVM